MCLIITFYLHDKKKSQIKASTIYVKTTTAVTIIIIIITIITFYPSLATSTRRYRDGWSRDGLPAVAVSPQNPEAQPIRTGSLWLELAYPRVPDLFRWSGLDDSAAEERRRKKFPLTVKPELPFAPLPQESRLKGVGAARSNCGKLDIVKKNNLWS